MKLYFFELIKIIKFLFLGKQKKFGKKINFAIHHLLVMGEQNKKSKLYLGSFIILFIGIAVMLFSINKKSNELERHRDKLIIDLEKLENKYAVLMQDKEETDSMLVFERSQVAMLIDSVKYLAKDVGELNSYKRSYFKLKKDKEILMAKADSLISANNILAEQKIIVEGKLSDEEEKNKKLTNKNTQLSETVAIGQILEAQAIEVYGVLISSSGKEKLKYKSQKVDKIKTCFTLGKNRIHPGGKTDIFLIISNPEGKVITEALDENSFFVRNEKMLYSNKQTIDYKNESQKICIYLDEFIEFTPGEYQIQIYTNKAKIGEEKLFFY